MTLDLYQLRAFHEAARLGGYTEAARRLHVTQSAVSHAIAKLEISAGRRLVEFRSRRLTLTPEGEALKECCERVFAAVAEAEGRLAGDGGELPLTIRIGAPTEFGTTVLLRKIRPLVEANPRLHLDFHFSDDLSGPLLRGDVDLAVDCRVHHHPALARTMLFREKYVVVAAPRFLAAHTISSPRDLARLPVLSMDKEGAWWGRMLQALPTAGRPQLRRIVQLNHLRGVIRAVLEGLGVGLVPKYAVIDDLATGAMTVLFPELPLLEDRFFVYQRASLAARPANRMVAEYLSSLDVEEFGGAIGPVRG